jgi:hypothetical protein
MPIATMQTVSVAQATYTTAATKELGFEPDSWTFFNESATATDVVMLSYDGVNDHGKLVPRTPIAALNWSTKRTRVWLRLESGAVAVNVCVMAGTLV